LGNLLTLKKGIVALCIALPMLTTAQNDVKSTTANEPAKKQWFETFQIRGYNQIRYNRLLETNSLLKNEQGDRSIGKDGGFFIRRSRIIFQGNVGKHVFLYVQPDLANALSGTLNTHYVQLRDCYMDVGLDEHNEFRFRIGQSKIPFGYENMQSSQNRLPLDRNDALNSAVSNERDLGVAFYYTPKKIRELYAKMVSDNLKGSGDYGVFGIMAYNGQTANRLEMNNRPHIASRLNYPLQYKKQILEIGVQGYKGDYVVTDTTKGVKRLSDLNYLDERLGATIALAPKPFGILAEYNIGKGPEYNKLTDSIEVRKLRGGFITCYYKVKVGHGTMLPFYRTQYYEGGKKHERDARSYRVTENEIGIEWQANKNFELTTMYTMSSRRWEDKTSKNFQSGELLRIQAQINF
jgi:hypothetical protein